MGEDLQYKRYDELIRDINSLKNSLYQVISKMENVESKARTVEEPIPRLREEIVQLELRIGDAFKYFKSKNK